MCLCVVLCSGVFPEVCLFLVFVDLSFMFLVFLFLGFFWMFLFSWLLCFSGFGFVF